MIFLPYPVVRRSSRILKLPTHLNDYEVTLNCTSVKYPIQNMYSANSDLHANFIFVMSNLNKVFEPICVKDALGDPNWKHTVDDEMNAFIKTNT